MKKLSKNYQKTIKNFPSIFALPVPTLLQVLLDGRPGGFFVFVFIHGFPCFSWLFLACSWQRFEAKLSCFFPGFSWLCPGFFLAFPGFFLAQTAPRHAVARAIARVTGEAYRLTRLTRHSLACCQTSPDSPNTLLHVVRFSQIRRRSLACFSTLARLT